MEHTVLWEHKTWNQKIQAAIDAGQIPLQHRIQMEQQLLVSGADQCLFMASNETESCHQWYLPDLELREAICDGWVQFLKDLEDTPDIADLSQDADWLILEGQYEAVMKKLASAEMSAKHLKGLMFEYAQERDVVGLNYRVQKTTRKGSISYAKAFKSLMPQADLEPFRGELVETLQLKEVKNG
jgi:predicted phage-related endonuclease